MQRLGELELVNENTQIWRHLGRHSDKHAAVNRSAYGDDEPALDPGGIFERCGGGNVHETMSALNPASSGFQDAKAMTVRHLFDVHDFD